MLKLIPNRLQTLKSSWVTSFAISGLILLLILRRLFSSPLELLDFFNAYYPAGRLIIENPEKLYSFSESIILGFVNLPILALLFTPFTWFEKSVAGNLFTGLGVVSVVLFGWWLIKIADLRGLKRLVFIALLVANTPIYYSIWLGNSTHMVFLFVIATFVCLQAKRDALSGICLAGAGLLKPPLLFLLLYIVVRKRFKAVIGCVVGLGVMFGLSVLFFGFNLNVGWFQECILKFSGQIVTAYNSQSVDSFLIRLMSDAPIDSWDLVVGDGIFKFWRYLLLAMLIGGTVLTVLRRPATKSHDVEGLEYSIFLTLTLVISPISWTHYYLFLLLPIALYLGGKLQIPRTPALQMMLLLSIFLVITPNVTQIPFQNPWLVAVVRYFWVSHFFFGGLILLGVLLTSHWRLDNLADAPNVQSRGFQLAVSQPNTD
jgi:hypothetical protein